MHARSVLYGIIHIDENILCFAVDRKNGMIDVSFARPVVPKSLTLNNTIANYRQSNVYNGNFLIVIKSATPVRVKGGDTALSELTILPLQNSTIGIDFMRLHLAHSSRQ